MRTSRRFVPAVPGCERRLLCDGDLGGLGTLPEEHGGPMGGLLGDPGDGTERTSPGDGVDLTRIGIGDPGDGTAAPHDTNPVDYTTLTDYLTRSDPTTTVAQDPFA